MTISEIFSLNAEAQLPGGGEGACRMGRLLTVVLALLVYWPVLMVLTIRPVRDGFHSFVLKEYFDMKGRNCVM